MVLNVTFTIFTLTQLQFSRVCIPEDFGKHHLGLAFPGLERFVVEHAARKLGLQDHDLQPKTLQVIFPDYYTDVQDFTTSIRKLEQTLCASLLNRHVFADGFNLTLVNGSATVYSSPVWVRLPSYLSFCSVIPAMYIAIHIVLNGAARILQAFL